MKQSNYEQTIEDKIYMLQKITHFDKKEMYEIINQISKMHNANYSTKPIKHSPITIEIVMKNQEEVSKLLNEGYEINEINDYGATPLITAIWCNNVEIVKILLDRGANVNIKCNNDLSPLHYACDKKNLEIIKLLIEKGSNVNEIDELGYNALQHLVDYGNTPYLSRKNGFFRELYCMTSNRDFTKSKKPSAKLIIEAINLLIKTGADINYCNSKNGINALSIALEVERLDFNKIVEHIIQFGSKKEAIEINPISLYEYQDSFDFINDLKDGDLSLWPGAPLEYLKFLEYRKRIKKNGITVYSNNMNDGYRRPKLLVKERNTNKKSNE